MSLKPTDHITSLQNPRIKLAVRLQNRKERDESDLFLIEGYRECKRAIDAGRSMEFVFFCPELFLGENEEALLVSSKSPLFQCTKEVFAKISYRDRPDGILAVAKQKHLKLTDLKLKANPF